MRQTVALVFLLLPMMAAGSQPQGTYQRATIQAHDGVPCFGVPDTRETRAAPPIIAGVTVTEVGKGHPPVWQRIFLREGSTEPALGLVSVCRTAWMESLHSAQLCARESTIGWLFPATPQAPPAPRMVRRSVCSAPASRWWKRLVPRDLSNRTAQLRLLPT